MSVFFKKNPWMWMGVLSTALVFAVGASVFRGGSEVSLENRPLLANEDGAQTEKLSREQSAELVSKLEADLSIPEEVADDGQMSEGELDEESGMKDGEQGAGNQEPQTADRAQSTTNGEQSTVKEEQNEGEEPAIEHQASKVRDIAANRLVSWGFQLANGRTIDTVVIHSTYNALGGDPFSVSKILDIYKSYGVSPHYLVARDGMVYRLVEEKNIAYHAGDSKMPDGRTNVNAFSIGIEVIGKDDGSPSDEQYVSLKNLLADIKKRYPVKHVLGHSDIAPGRKTDPWGFEWKKIGGKEL